jgi:hypothetical protein
MSIFYKKIVSLSLYLIWIQSTALMSQTLSGTVINQADKSPLPFANVFLNNTQIGTTTTESGSFVLTGVAEGTYDLIVSYIGYEVTSQMITVSKNNTPLEISLIPKSTELAEIVVEEDKNWQSNYLFFVENFIGRTPLASQCKIVNPDILYLKYDYDSLILKARTDEFLVIENKALGYRIKYLLVSFRDDARNRYQSILGYTLFEELEGSDKRKQKWQKERDKAYRGSFSHFCKALLSNTCEQEGFLVRKLERKPNPDRLPDDTIKAAFQSLRNQGMSLSSDTLAYWLEESRKPRLIEILNPNLIATDTLLSQEQGYTLFRFRDYLYVVYNQEKEDDLYLQQQAKFGREPRAKSFQSSLISLINVAAYFDSKGYIINPLAILTEGYWAWQEKVAEMLPIDYVPEEGK